MVGPQYAEGVLKYLYHGSEYLKPIYSNNGLVFGYHIEELPGGKPTCSIKLWQIYINGERPNSIPGADDSSFSVRGGAIPDKSEPYPAPVGYKMKLGDIEYNPKKDT